MPAKTEHLSSAAAHAFLAALPDKIQRALITYAEEMEYPVEAVLEIAIAVFLNPDSISFADYQLQGILETAFDKKRVLPERKIERIEQFLERFPEVKAVMVDGTERPVQRPQEKDKRKAHDSGKKKRFTRKPINRSTRQLNEENRVGNIPDQGSVESDLGFQGLQNEFVTIHLPHKKPKGQELSDQPKQENTEFSRQRVVCVACFP